MTKPNGVEIDLEGYDLEEDEEDEFEQPNQPTRVVNDPYLDDEEDEEDEFDNSQNVVDDIYDEEDDEEDEEQSTSTVVPQNTTVSLLDSRIPDIQRIMDIKNWDIVTLKQELYNKKLRELLESGGFKLDDVLLGIIPSDKEYRKLFKALYPDVESYLSQYSQPNLNRVHYDYLGYAIDDLLSEAKAEEQRNSPRPTEEDITPNHVDNQQRGNVADEIEEDDGVDPAVVSNVVEGILKVYDTLYAPCFLVRPKGIITSKGLLTFNMTKGKPVIERTGKEYIMALYNVIDSTLPSNGGGSYLGTGVENTTISSEYFDEEGNLTKRYSPVYHLLNVMGLKRLKDGSYQQVLEWSEYRDYLRKDITYKVTNVLEHFTGSSTMHIQRNLISLFTNCIIQIDFNITRSFELRYSLEGVTDKLGTVIKSQERAIFAKDFGEVISNGKNEFNVHNLLYVFDKDAYTAEILFSYKAYENLIRSGSKPDIKNVIVGKQLDGKDYTINLDDNTIKVVGIQAGSRSGKGVLTLNLMANILANGNPLVYLDYKPDMASVLWEMERYVNDKTGSGIRMLSLDALGGTTKTSKPVRYYPFGMGANPELPIDSKDWALFPYLKTLQLYALLIEQRHQGRYNKDKKFFIIMDEMQGFSKAYLPMIAKLQAYSSKYMGARKKEEPPASAVLAAKIAEIYGMDLKTKLTQVRDVTGGTGKTAMILLGQKVNPDEWSVDVNENGKTVKKPWKESFAAQLLASTDIKLIGKNAGSGTSYGLQGLKMTGSELIDSDKTRGYWVSSSSVKPTDSSSTVFKSYLTLNDNDFNPEEFKDGNTRNMPYTGGVLGGISNPVDRDKVINEDLLENGQVRKSIGLLGLMELITPDVNELAKNLATGYNAMFEMFTDLGLTSRYECLEEYLHDASDDSFFTYAELTDMLERPQGEDGEGGIDSSDSLMGDDSLNPAYDIPEELKPKRRTGWVDENGVFHPDDDSESSEEIKDSFNMDNDNLQGEEPYKAVYEAPPTHNQQAKGFDAIPIRGTDGNFITQPAEAANTVQPPIIDLNQPPVQQNPYTAPYNNSDIEPPGNYENPTQQYDPSNIPFTTGDLETIQQALEYGVNPSPNSIEDTLPKYKKPVKLDFNPFHRSHSNGGSYETSVKLMTEQLLFDIQRMVGSLGNVETLEFTSSAVIINDIIYRPTFEKEFLEELPFQVKYQVEQGNITELFHFSMLNRFPSLMVLRVDSVRLAEGRLRRELKIRPNKDWTDIYHKFPNLREFYIGGQRIVTPEELYKYKQSSKQGYDAQQAMAQQLGVDPNIGNRSYGDEAWNTPVYRLMTGVLGGNMGTKAMGGVNSVMGAFSMFLGALRQNPNTTDSQSNNQTKPK